MAADTPLNADRFTRAAHSYGPYSFCLRYDPKNLKSRTETQTKTQKTQAGARS
jgi:hypothetical protein